MIAHWKSIVFLSLEWMATILTWVLSTDCLYKGDRHISLEHIVEKGKYIESKDYIF